MRLDESRRFKPRIQTLATVYNIDPGSIRVFGSTARGDADEESDVDLLVHPLPACSVFDLSGLYEEVRQNS